jgi:hypothetical protein
MRSKSGGFAAAVLPNAGSTPAAQDSMRVSYRPDNGIAITRPAVQSLKN